MKKWIVIIVLMLCPLLMTGCASVGKEIQQTNVEQLQKGITTKDQVIKMFGQPDSTYFDKDTRLIFTYFAMKMSPSVYSFIPIINIVHNEMNMKNQMLVIVFSKDGIVEEYSFTNPDKKMSFGMVP